MNDLAVTGGNEVAANNELGASLDCSIHLLDMAEEPEANPAPNAPELTTEDVEKLLAWTWRTGTRLPPADALGIFEKESKTTGKVENLLRVPVLAGTGYTAPWVRLAWDAGPDGFEGAVDAYLPRRSERVDRENLRRMDRGEEPQEDISEDQLRAHSKAWLARVRAMQVSDEVGKALLARVDKWPEPQPLTTRVKPEPYPLDALPVEIREAVEEVAGFVQAPNPLIATCALGVISVAAQAHADVERAHGLSGPCSMFALVVADSGERKTTCDNFFSKAISGYEEDQANLAKPGLELYQSDLDSWMAERNGILDAIRAAAKAGKSVQELRDNLASLQRQKPEPPRFPRLLYNDTTPEKLTWNLAKVWPSAGVLSSEAGSVLGAHGMGSDSVMRNLATYNQCWDGGTQTFDRKTSESFQVKGARLSVSIQVQSKTLKTFFAKSGALARGTGFLARFLFAWPDSTMGSRFWVDPPKSWPCLAAYSLRMSALLNREAPITESGGLDPPKLTLSPAAKKIWIEYYNATEALLAPAGELYDIRDVAAKTADNAARLAGLFHLFCGASGGAIGEDHMARAVRIAAWHLTEARRFLGELDVPKEIELARILDDWLVKYCQAEQKSVVEKSHLLTHGPNALRKAADLDSALMELSSRNRVRVDKKARPILIEVNPDLLTGVNQ